MKHIFLFKSWLYIAVPTLIIFFNIALAVPIIHLTALCLFGYTFLTVRLRIDYKVFYLYICFVIYIMYYCMNTIVHQIYDFSYVYGLFLRYFLFMLSAYCLALIMHFKQIKKSTFYDLVIYIVMLQSCAVILSALFDGFRNFIDLIVPMGTKYSAGNFNGLRFRGFSNVANSALSIDLSLGVIFIIEKLAFSKSLKHIILYSVYILIVVLAIFFSGRSGFLAVGIILISFVIRFRGNLYTIIKIFVWLSLLITIIFTIVNNVFDLDNFTKNFNYAFEFFINGKSQSTDDLTNNMLFLPEQLTTWIFGDGQWIIPGTIVNYMGSDSGFVRALFVDGVIGVVVFYGSNYLYWLYSLYSMNKSDKFILVVMLIILTVYNVKDSAFYNGSGITFLIFLFCFYHETREEILN